MHKIPAEQLNRALVVVCLSPFVLAATIGSAVILWTTFHPPQILEHTPTRAEKLAKKNPLVVVSTKQNGVRIKVIRAVFNDKCAAVAFREVAHVWFYDSQVPCSQLPG